MRMLVPRRWVRAANHHGDLGRWALVVCKEPRRVAEVLREVG